MSDSKTAKALADLRKLEEQLKSIIEHLAGDSVEDKHEDVFPLIVQELREHGSMLDYELIEKLQGRAKKGRFGPDTTVWQAIESNVRHGKLVTDREVIDRTKRMKDRKATPNLKDRYYGYRISLPKK